MAKRRMKWDGTSGMTMTGAGVGDDVAATGMDRERAAWVGFNLVSGVGPVRTDQLLDHFGALADAWAASPGELGRLLDKRTLGRMVLVRREGQLDRVIERMDQTGIRAVIRTDPDYPERLVEIPAPPPVLYVRGEIVPADRHAVAIVGTRRMTAYGRDMTARIAAGLAEAGVTVVSGLAMGVDGVAHRAALEAGGRTIGVKGCGVNVPYPAAHVRMADEMAGSGAVISEYAPDRKPEAANFPARNRIISGLSLGTVVIEAPERSGALITVSFALDHGREVFVVPGDVRSEMSAGCNALLRDGARAVRSAEDILADLNLGGRQAPVTFQQALPVGEGERAVLDVLRGGPVHIDEIAAALGQPVFKIATDLMMLELDGRVRNTGGQVYAAG